MKQPNLYGCTAETLDSLLLTLLPPTDHEYIPLHDQHLDVTERIISGNYAETMPDIQEEVDIQVGGFSYVPENEPWYVWMSKAGL